MDTRQPSSLAARSAATALRWQYGETPAVVTSIGPGAMQALAGSLASKKKVPTSVGTFPTDGPLFVGLLVGVIVILYLLQYFPALSLGPVVEHYLMLDGKTF